MSDVDDLRAELATVHEHLAFLAEAVGVELPSDDAPEADAEDEEG